MTKEQGLRTLRSLEGMIARGEFSEDKIEELCLAIRGNLPDHLAGELQRTGA